MVDSVICRLAENMCLCAFRYKRINDIQQDLKAEEMFFLHARYTIAA